MADHLRKQIRSAAVNALTGLATTAARVKNSPVNALQESDLPGLRVFTQGESAQIASMGSTRKRERTLTLVVEACVKATTGYADTVDLIAKEVEVALDANNTLGGLCAQIEPRAFSEDQDGAGDKPVAVGRIEFEVLYYTRKGAPDTAA